MRFLFQAETLGFFDLGGVRLMLAVPEGSGGEGGSVLYFNVPSVPEAYEVLRGRGVTFEGEPHLIHRAETHELWMAFFRDSEGNIVQVFAKA